MPILYKRKVLGRLHATANLRKGKWGFINAKHELRVVSQLLNSGRSGIDRWTTPDYYDMIPETAKLTYDEEFGRVRQSGKAFKRLRKIRKRVIRYIRRLRKILLTKRLVCTKPKQKGTSLNKPNTKSQKLATLLKTYEMFDWCPKVAKLKIVEQL